jgi:hypothetical protein
MAEETSDSQSQKLRNLALNSDIAKDCESAKLVLEYTHKTASSLLQAYEKIRKARKAKSGTSTDQEQDLLRAMLVMAAAGLDGMAKQLIRDTMPSLVTKVQAVRSGLETFISRQIRGDADIAEPISGAKFVARLFAAPSHQRQAIEEYIGELTGGSLQSADELIRIGSAFGLQPQDIELDGRKKNAAQNIFDIRNKIIHELDMNLYAQAGRGKRKRNQRKVEDMKTYVETLLDVGVSLTNKVSTMLSVPKELGTNKGEEND